MNIETINRRCDKVMAFAFYAMIFFLPMSPAMMESLFGVAFFSYIIKRSCRFVVRVKDDAKSTNIKSIVYLYNAFRESFRPVASYLNTPIGFYTLIAFLSLVISYYFHLSFKGFFCKLLQGTFTYFMFIECMNTKKRIMMFLKVLFASFALIVFNGLFQYVVRREFIMQHPITDGRVTSSFKHANDFSGYLLSFLPVALTLSLVRFKKMFGFFNQQDNAKKKLSKWFYIGMLFIVVMATLNLGFTYSRSAWVAFAFSLIFLGLRNRKVLMIMVCVIILFTSFFANRMLKERTSDVAGGGLFDDSERLIYWQEALLIIKDHPLLGSGLNTYSMVAPRYKIHWGGYPHNCYLQTAAEMGILGLAAFLWILYRLFYHNLKNLSKVEDGPSYMLQFGLLAGMLGFLIHAFFDTDFYSVQLGTLLWLLMGVVVAVDKRSINNLA